MYEILKTQHGYIGCYESVAKCVHQIREQIKPEKKEAYIPLTFAPADAFQFDWGDVYAYVGGKLNKLNVGIVVLCHSRYFFARAYPCQKQELMLDVQQRAFEFFGGSCNRGIYDNLKTAVKSLLKSHHRNLQERFVQFCSYYLFQPQFCNPARGNEKGRIESKVGFINRNFFIPTPRFDSMEELNERLLAFCLSKSRITKHPDETDKSCYEVYEQEKDKLVQLPAYDFECCRTRQAVVSTVSTVFFENNRYSVPTKYVSKAVQVKGYADEVVVSYQGREIARHKRSYGRNHQEYNPFHYLRVLARKPRAFADGKPFKNWQLPEVFANYRILLNKKYEDGDRYFAKTLILLNDWPIKDVMDAIKKSIALGVVGEAYILTLLRQDREPPDIDTAIALREELSRYRAQQKPLSEYDNVLIPKRVLSQNEWK